MSDYSFTCFVPDLLKRALESKFIEFNISKTHQEYYFLFTSILVRNLHKEYKQMRIVSGTVSIGQWHCHLWSKYLQDMLGHYYLTLCANLEDWGILHRSKSYQKGDGENKGQCKAFWLDFQYMSYLKEYYYSREATLEPTGTKKKKYGRMSKVKIEGVCLLKRVKNAAIDVKNRQLQIPAVSKCHENLKHFQVDVEQATQVAFCMVEDGEMTMKQLDQEMKKVDRFNSIFDSETALFVKQDHYGRIHTNITNMKREIRNACIYCDGKETVSVDMKSSQAAILAYILGMFVHPGQKSFIDEESPFITVNPAILSDIPREQVLMEYQKLLDILHDKHLYEFFAEEISKDPAIGYEISRAESKKAFLPMLFSKVYIVDDYTPMWAAVRRVWNHYFPSLLRCIDYMKKENYARLAYEMQRNESNFVFGKVIPRIEQEIGCWYCTVHDSVVVAKEYGNAVQKIMDSELAKVGIPTMTEQEYDIRYPSIHQRTLDNYVQREMDYTNSREVANRTATNSFYMTA